MADLGLAGVTAAAAAGDADLLYVTQGGNTRKMTAAQLLAYAAAVTGPLPRIAGRWYSSILAPMGAAANALAVNSIAFLPFWVPQQITISTLAVYCSTAQASKNIRMAVYANGAGKPTGNPVAATASASTASTGFISADITGADVVLTPGWYWFGVMTDGSTAIYQYPSGSGAYNWTGFLAGETTLANLALSTGFTAMGLNFANTFGNGFPDMTANSLTAASSHNGATGYYLVA